MRSLVGLYFLVGIVLLALGFFATGDCLNKNRDILNNAVFILAWPVYLYGDVVKGPMSPEAWLHAQACQAGGLHGARPLPPPVAPPLPPPGGARQ